MFRRCEDAQASVANDITNLGCSYDARVAYLTSGTIGNGRENVVDCVQVKMIHLQRSRDNDDEIHKQLLIALTQDGNVVIVASHV